VGESLNSNPGINNNLLLHPLTLSPLMFMKLENPRKFGARHPMFLPRVAAYF
jgi:hypothetical protein